MLNRVQLGTRDMRKGSPKSNNNWLLHNTIQILSILRRYYVTVPVPLSHAYRYTNSDSKNTSNLFAKYSVSRKKEPPTRILFGGFFAAEAPEKLSVSVVHVKHQLEIVIRRVLGLLGSYDKITCLDCSSVISSDAFIPLSVINLHIER